ncbi:MAG: hypothetical protein QJR13_08615, partial [Bacillota bacterium]|nr:hypothetical protein [Bacillota bacterium]
MSQRGRIAPLDARTVADMENLLAQVQNVVSVKIVTDHFGHIQEVHAVAEPGTNPKTVVRDFEAVLFTRWNIRIDRRKISVALLKDPNPPPAQPPRLRIRYMGLKVTGMEAEARVELVTPMQTGEGRAYGLATQSNRLRLMSEATLSAVSRFLQEGYHLVLEDIRSKSVGD